MLQQSRRAMRNVYAAFMALAVALPLAALARQPAHSDVWNGAEIDWRDARSGIYESAHSGKTVIMVFHATWCTFCKKYRKVFFDKDVVAAAKDFVMILVDADADKTVNGAFAPDGSYVPRTIFLDSNGNIQSDLKAKGDPKYPHSVDIDGPGELLGLMRRAHDKLAPAAPPASEDRT